MILACDIDHTISDAAWRDGLLGDWPAYNAASIEDLPFKGEIAIINRLEITGIGIVLVTARQERWRDLTVRWCVTHNVRARGLLMRPDGDFRPSRELKFDLCRTYIGLENLVGVWDDREDVLAPFRELSIPTHLVYHGPRTEAYERWIRRSDQKKEQSSTGSGGSTSSSS